VVGFPTAFKLATVTGTLAGRAFVVALLLDDEELLLDDEELLLLDEEELLLDEELLLVLVLDEELAFVLVVLVVVPLPVLDDDGAFVVVPLVPGDEAALALVVPVVVAADVVVPCAATGISGISSENASVCVDRISSAATLISGPVVSSAAGPAPHAAQRNAAAPAKISAKNFFISNPLS